MDNLSDFMGTDAFSSGNLFNDFSQQMPGLDSFQADSLSHQAFGVDDMSTISPASPFGVDGAGWGICSNEQMSGGLLGMPDVSDSAWHDMMNPHGLDGVDGLNVHDSGFAENLQSDWSTPMSPDLGMPDGTPCEWANVINFHCLDGSNSSTPHSSGFGASQSDWSTPTFNHTEQMGSHHFGFSHHTFLSDPVSSVPKIDDMSINQYGWVYKGNDRIGEIRDANVYDYNNNYIGHFKVGGEVYDAQGDLIGKVAPCGDEYDPEGHKIGHIDGTLPIPKGAADMLLVRRGGF